MIKITPVSNKIKFSYETAKGSAIVRRHKTEDIINSAYDEIFKSDVSETIPVTDLKGLIKRVLPEKKRIDIVNLIDENTSGGEDFLSSSGALNSKEKFIGYKIDLPLTDNKFSIMDLTVFIHEFTHVLDSLFNPKYSSRMIKCDDMVANIYSHCPKIKSFENRYDDCYRKSLYTEEKFSSLEEIPVIINKIRNEVLKLLKGRKPEEKITILQNYRYYLQSEDLAYNNERMIFGRIMEDKHKYDEESLNSADSSQYLFKEKIQMLKELCFEEIQKFRQELAQKRGAK